MKSNINNLQKQHESYTVSEPYDYQYVYRPNRFLSYDSSSRWFDIYDSWVIKGYREYFDQLTSDIGSGIKYGGGWFHSSVGSKFNINLAKKANIGFVITPKNQNCIKLSSQLFASNILLAFSAFFKIYKICKILSRF